MDWGRPLLLAGAGPPIENLSIFDPASPPAESIRNLSILVFAITAFIFVWSEGVLLYCYRSDFAAVAAGRDTEPPQVYGSKPIEIAWTAAPALIVFILVLVTARTLWEVNVPPPEPRAGDNRSSSPWSGANGGGNTLRSLQRRRMAQTSARRTSCTTASERRPRRVAPGVPARVI